MPLLLPSSATGCTIPRYQLKGSPKEKGKSWTISYLQSCCITTSITSTRAWASAGVSWWQFTRGPPESQRCSTREKWLQLLPIHTCRLCFTCFDNIVWELKDGIAASKVCSRPLSLLQGTPGCGCSWWGCRLLGSSQKVTFLNTSAFTHRSDTATQAYRGSGYWSPASRWLGRGSPCPTRLLARSQTKTGSAKSWHLLIVKVWQKPKVGPNSEGDLHRPKHWTRLGWKLKTQTTSVSGHPGGACTGGNTHCHNLAPGLALGWFHHNTWVGLRQKDFGS